MRIESTEFTLPVTFPCVSTVTKGGKNLKDRVAPPQDKATEFDSRSKSLE